MVEIKQTIGVDQRKETLVKDDAPIFVVTKDITCAAHLYQKIIGPVRGIDGRLGGGEYILNGQCPFSYN